MANEGALGSLGGSAAGAGIGFALGGPIGAGIGAGIGGTGGGIIGSLFGDSGPKAPDISKELAKIDALFAKLRAQNTANINQQAAQGRTAAASNLAARGVYRAPVSENTFNQLERDRLNSIANSDAALAGQEAETRSGLLSKLLGLNYDAGIRSSQIDAQRTGALTGLSSSLLLAMLQGRGGDPYGESGSYGKLPGGGYGMRYAGATGSGNTRAYGPSANFY